MANEALGFIDCETCGAECEVCQAVGKRADLYTRCPNCGTDQRNGSAVQTRLFFGTRWKDGARVAQPSKASSELWESMQARKAKGLEAEKNAEVKPVQDTEDTEAMPKPDAEEHTEKKPKGGGIFWGVVGLISLCALAAGVSVGGAKK